jgi:hypothetical protein
VRFVWSQWAQMGVFARTQRRDAWAQDPEALLVFTLHVARGEPRLFDDVLDWLRLNGRLISGRRLASLCPAGDVDRRLVEAAVGWAQAHGSPLRIADAHQAFQGEEELFEGYSVARPDGIFRSYGYLKPVTSPSLNSSEPQLREPVNLAFRLREHFGLASSRAEIVRFLLTSGRPDADALTIAEAAAYAKRNVHETLAALVAAGDVDRYTRGNEGRYSVDRVRWASFLGTTVDRLPVYRDWPRLLLAFREIDRWLADPRHTGLTEYMRASEARTIMERLEPSLAAAGMPVVRGDVEPDYWSVFEQRIAGLLDALGPAGPG